MFWGSGPHYSNIYIYVYIINHMYNTYIYHLYRVSACMAKKCIMLFLCWCQRWLRFLRGRRSPKGNTWHVIMILRRSSRRPFITFFSYEELLEKERLKELTHMVSPVADIPEEKQLKVGSPRGDTTRSSIL